MVAMSHEGQARALLALDRLSDRQQATALLDEVTATARALGIRGLGSQAHAAHGRHGRTAGRAWRAGSPAAR